MMMPRTEMHAAVLLAACLFSWTVAATEDNYSMFTNNTFFENLEPVNLERLHRPALARHHGGWHDAEFASVL